ncbi:MAG: hypothetical protein ABID71_03350 [Chloroflexota bacterium]
MILVWNDAKSFERHLEAMRIFRHSHPAAAATGFQLIRDMPASGDLLPSEKAGGATGIISSGGKSIIVPIWDIALPGGCQN